jgi:hypothetical protein
MTDSPSAAVAAAAAASVAATTTTRKHVSEGLDFWYALCRKFDDNKAKYKNKLTIFLDHEDSGPGQIQFIREEV